MGQPDCSILLESITNYEKIGLNMKTKRIAHLDEVTKQLVGFCVGFLHLLELVPQPHTVCLEVEIGVLATWDLVLIDIRIPRLHGGGAVKWSINASGHLPILTVVKDLLKRDA